VAAPENYVTTFHETERRHSETLVQGAPGGAGCGQKHKFKPCRSCWAATKKDNLPWATQ